MTIPAPRSGAAPAFPLIRRQLGSVLIEHGVITHVQLEEALTAQSAGAASTPRPRLGSLLVDAGLATDAQVARALAASLGLEYVDLLQATVSPDVVRGLPRVVAERGGVLLLGRHAAHVVVATSEPTNVVVLDDVRLCTGAAHVEVLVATAAQIRTHLARAWSLPDDPTMGLSTLVAEEPAEPEAPDADAAPIVRLLSGLLSDAVRARASDVHIETQADEVRIRYRVDGLLRDIMSVQRAAAGSLVSRIKIVSGLDIAERRRPQDGRAKIVVDGVAVEARVSTLPTVHGEKAVVRLLPRAESIPQLAATGLSRPQLATVTSALLRNQGLVLITGPTGSGKTNTLYSGIQHISTPDRNIVALEDPVEIQVPGVTQVQVHEAAGMTFARGLRSVLRQDPDVVLVGEVRDQETAELALQASLTGHLVLTTLHTNDAVSAITRLVDMGVEPFLVASSLTLVIAQRLLRTPCASCVRDYTPSAATLQELGLVASDLVGATPRNGQGCSDCGGTGYRGRTGVFEVLPVTAALRSVLLSTPTEAAIGAAARAQEMTSLRGAALVAAHEGRTTYEEVLRATSVDEVEGPRCPTCARTLAEDMVCCPWDGTAIGSNRCLGCARDLDPQWHTCPWCQTTPVAAAAGLRNGPAELPDEALAGAVQGWEPWPQSASA